MHIGGVSILDPRTPRGRFGLDDLRRLLAARLNRSRTFTQRLVEVPLKLGNPYWVEDEEFDLDRHLERTQLPEPGGFKELRALVAWEMSQPLPRDRPLWQLLFVEGVDGVDDVPRGSVALIAKIHHAAIDGISGTEIMSALYDVSPQTVEEAPVEVVAPAGEPEGGDAPAGNERRRRRPSPGAVELLRQSGRHLIEAPGAISGAVGDTLKGLLRSGAAWGLKRVKPPPLPFSAPPTRFNAPIGRERVWSGEILSLDRIKAIRQRVEATVNDVVLAVCAGALRRYLSDKDELPQRPLVAMVPISVRSQDERGTMGNVVSAMLVSLATDEPDPGERLRKIRQGALDSKVHHRAVGARTLSDYTEFIPFALAGLGVRLYTGLHLAEKHKPVFNLVITNVPGPQVPLYVAGARLLAQVGTGPIFDGMGLIMPVFSYNGALSIAANSDRAMMPDVEVFTGYLADALDELESAVGGA
jgi:WS/DGAT/MGAT family acyltransferase